MPGIDHALQVIRVTSFCDDFQPRLKEGHELRLTAIFAELTDADRLSVLLGKDDAPYNGNERTEKYFVSMIEGLFTAQYSRADILLDATLRYLVHNDYDRVRFYIPPAIVGVLKAAQFCHPLEPKNPEFESALPKVLGSLFGELIRAYDDASHQHSPWLVKQLSEVLTKYLIPERAQVLINGLGRLPCEEKMQDRSFLNELNHRTFSMLGAHRQLAALRAVLNNYVVE